MFDEAVACVTRGPAMGKWGQARHGTAHGWIIVFTLPDLEGRPHALVDYRGKKVFLVFWASW